MQSGGFVDDKLTAKLIDAALAKVGESQEPILDGYPRRMSQLVDFEPMLRAHHQQLRAVIVLQVSQAEAVQRLLSRGRPDDKADSIARRWADFATETKEVIDHFRPAQLVHEIDGEGTLEEVAARIQAIFDED